MQIARKIRITLRENPVLKRFIRPFIAWLALKVLKRKQRLIKKYGYKAVQQIFEASKAVGIICYPDYGTLLGFVRDNGFIAHDCDIDFGFMPDEDKVFEFYKELERRGFIFERFILFDGKLKEFSMSYNEISIDFFYRYYTEDRKSVWTVVTYKDGYWPIFIRPIPKDFKETILNGASVFMPGNSEDILTVCYGNWKTPIKQWESTMAPGFTKDYGTHTNVMYRDKTAWERLLKEMKRK